LGEPAFLTHRLPSLLNAFPPYRTSAHFTAILL
jgi:hypothetical protein